MKIPHEKGVANHSAPNFARCVARHVVKRKGGEEVGWVLSSEKLQSGRRRCQTVRKATGTGAVARVPGRSCVVEDPRHASILTAREPGDLVDACAVSRPTGEGLGRTARMYVSEESDRGIVLMNPSNQDGRASAEKEEGRPRVKEKIHPPHTCPTQCGKCVPQGLADVRPAKHRCAAMYPRQEPYALTSARTDPCGGQWVTTVPTATDPNCRHATPDARCFKSCSQCGVGQPALPLRLHCGCEAAKKPNRRHWA